MGYRWRERNQESLQDFEDGVFFLLQAGRTIEPVGIQAVIEEWDGATPVIEGLRVPDAERRMLQVTPTVSYGVGPGRLKTGARFPLAGKNLPAGTALVLGYFTGWSF